MVCAHLSVKMQIARFLSRGEIVHKLATTNNEPTLIVLRKQQLSSLLNATGSLRKSDSVCVCVRESAPPPPPRSFSDRFCIQVRRGGVTTLLDLTLMPSVMLLKN